jgi:hypothetical protein
VAGEERIIGTDLDILEVLRATLDALDKLVEGQLRSAGSVESQRAANLAQRARHLLDGVSMRALQREAG